MSHRIARSFYWLVPIVLLSLCPFLNGQESASQEKREQAQEKQEHKAAKGMQHPKTVTGCLQKGDEPDEFTITGKDGKMWELRSDSVKLAEHVGHTVTVTGTSVHESKAQEKKEKAEEKKEGKVETAAGKQEMGDLQVSSLKMVSATCSK